MIVLIERPRGIGHQARTDRKEGKRARGQGRGTGQARRRAGYNLPTQRVQGETPSTSWNR